MNSTELQLDFIARQLRHAVGREDFAAVTSFGRSYTQALEAAFAGLPPAEREAAFLEARGLFEWARRGLLICRAGAAGELRRLKVARQYRAAPCPPLHSWHVNA
jgi:hypothetical protein